MSEIIYLTDLAIITCIVDKEQSETVLHAARDVGARAAVVHSAQGWGIRERLGAWGVAVETERDVIQFMVSSDQQDLIFDAIYQTAGLDAPGRGFMFISPVERGATYVPEAVREQLGVDTG
jgi:nitrogen regulatory protein PII